MRGRSRPRRRPGQPRLRLVRPPGPKRFGFLVVAFGLAGLVVFGVVALQALVSQNSFRMQRVTQRTAALEDGVGRLRLQVAQLSAPDRITEEARRLGLRLPGDVQTITIQVPASRLTGDPDEAGLPSEPGPGSGAEAIGGTP